MATKRKEYLCLISTDVNLDENEIVRIHEKHWDIEVFLKVCKSHLNLSREFNDNRSLGELFYTFQMKCSISHGYRLFKCCFKCSGQCFQTTPNFQIKNQRIDGHIYEYTSGHFESKTASCIKLEH